MIRTVFHSRVAAGVALVGGVVFAGFGVTAAAGTSTFPEADPDELALVERFAGAVTTFDSGRVDADIARILELGTADFAEEFRSTMGETFVADLEASGSVSVGEVLAGPTLQRVDASTSVFFVVVNQQVTTPSTSAPGETAPDGSGQTVGSQPQTRIIRVGLLVQVDRDRDLVTSVQVL